MRRQQRVRGGRRHHLVLQMCQFRWSSRGWGLRWAPSHHGAGRFSAGVSGKICSCLLRSYLSPIFPHNLSYNFFYNFYKCHPQAVSERNLQSCLFHQRFSTNLHKCHPTSCLGDTLYSVTFDQFFPTIFHKSLQMAYTTCLGALGNGWVLSPWRGFVKRNFSVLEILCKLSIEAVE